MKKITHCVPRCLKGLSLMLLTLCFALSGCDSKKEKEEDPILKELKELQEMEEQDEKSEPAEYLEGADGLEEGESFTALKSIVESANASCPQDQGDGIVWTSIKLRGKNVVYTYELDDTVIPEEGIQNILKAKAQLKANLISSLSALKDDVETATFLKVCVNSHVDLIYRYERPSTGEYNEITITNSELRTL